MPRRTRMARYRARWAASALMLGITTLSTGGAWAQGADTGVAPTDPNVIRGLQVTTGVTLDGAASVSRQIINAQGALTTPGINTDTNQTTVSTYTISPTLRQRFGDFASGLLKYQFGSTSSGAIAPATQNSVLGSLTSGTD